MLLTQGTYSFKLGEIKLLQKAIYKKFALETNFFRDRDREFRMYFRKKETQKLIPLILQFVVPNLAYKIL